MSTFISSLAKSMAVSPSVVLKSCTSASSKHFVTSELPPLAAKCSAVHPSSSDKE